MTAASVTARGQAAAEALMVDTCTITRITGSYTDPDSGEITPTTTEVYSGKCRVQQVRAHVREEDAGQAYALMLILEVQLPMSVTGVRTEDYVTITSASLDADLDDRVFIVQDLMHKTHATARRLRVQERTS